MQAGWLAEFRRRNVHRVLIAYFADAWLLAQVIEFLSDAFAWPAWILRALVMVLLLGLPAAPAPPLRSCNRGIAGRAALQAGRGDRSDEALEFGMADTLILRLSGIA